VVDVSVVGIFELALACSRVNFFVRSDDVLSEYSSHPKLCEIALLEIDGQNILGLQNLRDQVVGGLHHVIASTSPQRPELASILPSGLI